MAWHGWKTIGEAERYVEQANMMKLADSAAAFREQRLSLRPTR